MKATYFRWDQGRSDLAPNDREEWCLEIELRNLNKWDLMAGRNISAWDVDTVVYYDIENGQTDYSFTDINIPVYSPYLCQLMRELKMEDIQYLPVRLKQKESGREIEGYHIANYLRLIDCLDREHSEYVIWTKENLLFWERRSYMLGTFRDVKKAVLDITRAGDARLFRLWGWEMMVIVREDVKTAIEEAGITGGRFTRLETSPGRLD
jgi:hypothetical protein